MLRIGEMTVDAVSRMVLLMALMEDRLSAILTGSIHAAVKLGRVITRRSLVLVLAALTTVKNGGNQTKTVP